MCCLFCFCNWCNSLSSKCVEITILFLSVSSLIPSLISLFCVKIEHTSKIAFACLVVVFSLSIILIIIIIIILIWRYKSIINTTRNSLGSIFSVIGLIITIFCILFIGIWESLSVTKFTELNYPCQNLERNEFNSENKERYLLNYEENKEEFCLEYPDYNSNVVSNLEYICLLVCASTLELILLVLLYFWYSDFRRIKFLVDGQLIDSNTKENKMKYNLKKNNYVNNFNIYGQTDYVAHYDIFGKPIFNFKKRKNKSTPINIYSNKRSINVIRNKNVDDEDKNKIQNKKSVDIQKVVIFEKNENDKKSSDRTDNIYSLKFKNLSRNRVNNLINNYKSNSSKTAVLENSVNNKI